MTIDLDTLFTRIAILATHGTVETIETRNSDGLDFHDIHVSSMREMMAQAFLAGQAAAMTATAPKRKAKPLPAPAPKPLPTIYTCKMYGIQYDARWMGEDIIVTRHSDEKQAFLEADIIAHMGTSKANALRDALEYAVDLSKDMSDDEIWN